MAEAAPLYRRILGDDFDRLPAELRGMHDISVASIAEGAAEITRGTSVFSRLIGWVSGLPEAGSDVPAEVRFVPEDRVEHWRRTFGNASFQTRLTASPDRTGHVVERVGPMRFLLAIPVDDDGLSMILEGMWVFGLPVPRLLWPRVRATERVADGLFAFDVTISAPLAGLIIRYRGRLQPPRPIA